MACERDILPTRLREAIARFFQAQHLWLQRVLEAGIGSGMVRQDLDPAIQASLVLSALQGALMVWHLFGEADGFDATVAALLKSLR
jgi:hypothetical protein